MVMDATNWDEDAYRNTILHERETQCRTVFRAIFAPSNPNPNPDIVVAASSDGSVAAYSLSSILSSIESRYGVPTPQHCGDDGRIRGWKWKELEESETPIHKQGSHVKPSIDLMNPQHRGPWYATSPISENNAIAVDHQRGSIYAAAGDSCAYCWDVETSKIKTVFRGHLDYLHSIIARTGSNQIITGSEDGTARIWDCRNGKCVQVISPKRESLKEVSSVSCIALDASESWLVKLLVSCSLVMISVFEVCIQIYCTLRFARVLKACGSGKSLYVWNLLASEQISRISTPTTCQDVVFDDNHILTVGASSMLSRMDMNGKILSQIRCAPESAFSVSLHQSGVIAVAGYTGLVDVVSQFGSHSCTFRCTSDSGGCWFLGVEFCAAGGKGVEIRAAGGNGVGIRIPGGNGGRGMGKISLKMWHGGVFRTLENGTLCYMNGVGRTFNVDPDELCSFYLMELVMKCARYENRIKGFLYLVPGLSMVDGLRRVTDDDSMREMIKVAEKYRGVEASSKQNQPKTVRSKTVTPKKIEVRRGPPVRSSPRKQIQPLTIVEPSQKAPDSSPKPKKDAPTEFIPNPPSISLSNQSTFKVKYVINPSSISEIGQPPNVSKIIAASKNTNTDPIDNYEWEDSRPDRPIPINDLIPDYFSESDKDDPSYNPVVDKGKGVVSQPFFGDVYTDEEGSGEDLDAEEKGAEGLDAEVYSLEEIEEEV
uniref:PB1-like domain-containing protein n=1 Tax=Chenopodium quinoa TaxID=63459 RepID=A0A803MRN2_CHEQI